MPVKSSTNLPQLTLSLCLLGRKKKESNGLQKLALPSPFHPSLRLFNCILLIHSPSRHSLPVFLLCPCLCLPGARLSGSVPVCLFADDSTWSRCDAQQLLLCAAALCSNLSYALIYLHIFLFPLTAPLNRKWAS